MIDAIISAFTETHSGYSADRVVADPELNPLFIEACRRHGLEDPTVELNWSLQNIKKKGGRLLKTTRPTTFRNQSHYRFAAEMAIRALERKHNTTLDRILCDPELAKKFDGIAEVFSPGFKPLEYRWAALSLRKKNALKPEPLSHVVPAEVHGPFPVTGANVNEIPSVQGLYVLSNREKVLYVGEAISLRARLKKHLDHSDNKHLARYVWEFGTSDMILEYHVLPPKTLTRVRKAMELALIRQRRAEFNVQR